MLKNTLFNRQNLNLCNTASEELGLFKPLQQQQFSVTAIFLQCNMDSCPDVGRFCTQGAPP